MSLGKGLGSLIPVHDSATNIENQAAAADMPHAQDAVNELAVTDIEVNPLQPRHHFSHQELEELISSIKQYGVLQPLLVCKVENGYQLIAGERRLRASRIAGLEKVPVIIREVSDLEKLELALIENIQRSDLNPVEKAEGYYKLINEFGLNHEEAAKKIGISRSNFSNVLRLLDLPGEVQKALADRKISEGHAKVLLGLPNRAEQLRVFKKVLQMNMSVRDLSADVKGATKQSRRTSSTTEELPFHLQDFQEQLTTRLSTRVNIKPKGSKGEISIQYFSPEELSEIVKRITD